MKIPPTHPCFIVMKNRKERASEIGRSSFEKSSEKYISLSQCHDIKTFDYKLPH